MIVLDDTCAKLAGVEPGEAHLHGRRVWWTGRVAIGARIGEIETPRRLDWTPRVTFKDALSADALKLQAALIDKPPSVFAIVRQWVIGLGACAALGVLLAWGA